MGYSYRGSNSSSLTKKYARSGTGTRRAANRQRRQRGGGQYINPTRFIKIASQQIAETYNATNTFAEFEMHEQLRKNIERKGFTRPTPVQDQTIPAGLAGKDIIGIAGTGTGKTTAFALPVIHKLLNGQASTALIVAPTRELAQQIEKELWSLTEGTSIRSTLIIGGANMGAQIRNLQRRPRIIIGTPGRIKDHLQRGTMKLNQTNLVVLDEVDRMLDMGFLPDVRMILGLLPKERQSFFFSATLEPKIMGLVNSFTTDPHTVQLQPESTGENIHQNVVDYKGKEMKMSKLHDALIDDDVKKAIIFEETKHGVDRLHKELQARGFSSDSIHGGKSQGQRQRALARFKNNDVSILVATDVAARGIDVIDITHVINYSIPKVFDDYIHRIGRAGRAGRVGHALTFVESAGSTHVTQ